MKGFYSRVDVIIMNDEGRRYPAGEMSKIHVDEAREEDRLGEKRKTPARRKSSGVRFSILYNSARFL